MKKRLFLLTNNIVWLALTLALVLYFLNSIYPDLKQCYAIDIESAPGIEHTIKSLKIYTLIIVEIYFGVLYISAIIISMIFADDKKRKIADLCRILILLITCGSVCTFLIFNFGKTDYYVINIVVAIIGYVIQISVITSGRIINYYKTKAKRKYQE